MTYVISASCVKDDVCVAVCPVECIHPGPRDPDFETAEQLYIDPGACIDCNACAEACPVGAIYSVDELPTRWIDAAAANADFFVPNLSRRPTSPAQIR